MNEWLSKTNGDKLAMPHRTISNSIFVFTNDVYLFNQCWITQLDSHKWFWSFFVRTMRYGAFLLLSIHSFYFNIFSISKWSVFRSGRDNFTICMVCCSANFNIRAGRSIVGRTTENSRKKKFHSIDVMHIWLMVRVYKLMPAYLANRKQSTISSMRLFFPLYP